MMLNKFCVLSIVILSGLNAIPAYSASAVSKSFKVTADVSVGCQLKESNLQIKLPPIFIGNRVSSAQLQFQLLCTPGAKVNIALNNGLHPAADGTKQLQFATSSGAMVDVPYSIYYIDSSGNKQPWQTVALSGSALDAPITMEADVKDTGSLVPGTYTDTLVMSITY